ncbi:MAG: pectate lyase [Spirochaetes bacterium]|nr:pectate lyase [Spirochaetota bacterium]
MRKGSFILLSILIITALVFWFSCNPFNKEKSSTLDKINVLDSSGGTRLTITCTIIVNGSTWDGGGQTIIASGMGDGSQAESQDPIFDITNGTVRNVTIGAPACDGIHLEGGNSTISNVKIPDVGEDACTVKKPGTYNVSSFTGNSCEDKLFQINDLCTITYTSISANGMSKFCRQNGGKTWKCTIYINGATLSGISEAVVRSDSTTTSVRWRSITANIAQSSWWYGNFSVAAY